MNSKHVYQDLEPYTCTFADCEHGIESFQSRRQWANHEFSKHRKMPKWTCYLCNFILTTELGVKLHLSEQHSDLNGMYFRFPTCGFRRLSSRCKLYLGSYLLKKRFIIAPQFLGDGNTDSEFMDRSGIGIHARDYFTS